MFAVPRRNQGQIIEVSYGRLAGQVVRQTYDRRDDSAAYAISPVLEGDSGNYMEEPPPGGEWTAISEDEIDRLIAGDRDWFRLEPIE